MCLLDQIHIVEEQLKKLRKKLYPGYKFGERPSCPSDLDRYEEQLIVEKLRKLKERAKHGEA